MYEYTTAQNQSNQGASKNFLTDNRGIQNAAAIPMNPGLPPIRRINNHLPPKNLRISSVQRTEGGHAKPATNEENNNFHSKFRDGESVMNFSGSESDSESEDSYTDDDSDDQTTISYVEDDTPATNFNCMNSLFMPTGNDQEMNEAAIIRCHRVGPGSAELQLNIPLPAQWNNMQHLPTVQEGQRSGYLNNVCKAPSLNYNQSQYDPDEAVVEIDPFKQYRERIAPQFYESLIAEDSDEDADSDSDDDENQNSSVRQHDDSQIFGHLDAERSAIQEAMYNDIVLRDGFGGHSTIRSPPSQIFVTESTCSGIELVSSEQGSQEVTNFIELSIDGSLEVFSRPGDCQDSSLNKHLRDAAEVGFAAPPKVNDIPKQTLLAPSSPAPSIRVLPAVAVASVNQLIEAAPSMDESGPSSLPATRPSASSANTVLSVNENERNYERDGDDEPFDSVSFGQRGEGTTVGDLSRYSRRHSAAPDDMAVKQRLSNSAEPSRVGSSEKDARPSLATFSSFDEPGRITSRSPVESNIPVIVEKGKQNKRVLLSNDPIADVNESSSIPTKQPLDSEDAPDDEIFSISRPALKPQTHDEDGPADENIGFSNTMLESSSPSRSSASTPCDFDSVQNVPKVRFMDPILEEEFSESASIDGENDSIERKVDAPLKRFHQSRFVNRPILEETSKSNEVYETRANGESPKKSSRELRMDRLRSFDPVSPALAATTIGAVFDRASQNDTSRSPQPKIFEESSDIDQVVDVPDLDSSKTSLHEEGGSAPQVEIDEVDDLDDLMEFHSCDEDFFMSHTSSEQLSSTNFY
jgi:hypothetical protein